MVDMQKLTHGVLHTKFWVVDQTHFYIGSANMDWRSLTQVCLYPVHLLFQATLSSAGHPASNCIPPQSQSPLCSVCNGFLPTYYQASLNDPKSSPLLPSPCLWKLGAPSGAIAASPSTGHSRPCPPIWTSFFIL